MNVRRPYEALRQPEYTGENRCVPCTTVNVLVGAVASGVVGLVSPWLGVATFAVSVALVALRGYLVPGTPTLTRRYLPDAVVRRFEDQSDVGYAHVTGVDGDGLEGLLRSVDVLTDCPDVDDLCLTDGFRDRWREHAERLRPAGAPEDAFAALLGVDADRVVCIGHGNAYVVNVDGELVGKWESRAAFIADVAAERALAERHAGWADLDLESRSRAARSLRAFLERCPDCDGPASVGEETVSSCCRTTAVLAVTCEHCDARLFEVERPAPGG